MSALPRIADAVVVGGGIMGTSIAWHLARRGLGRVVLVERSMIAAGASGRTGALLRRHYSNRPEAQLAQIGWQTYRDWDAIVGGNCGFVPHGLVVTVNTGPGFEDNAELVRRNVAMQQSIGIQAKVVSRSELEALQPSGRFDDLTVAAYEPESGYVDAIAATRSMALAARRAGVGLYEGVNVAAIDATKSEVHAVITGAGAIATPIVIVAAGPWSPAILDRIGISVPVTALRVQVVVVQHPLALGEELFAYVDTATGMFCRPWGPGRTLIGLGGGDQHDQVDPERFDGRNDSDYAAQAIRTAARRFPAMADAIYLHGHAGLYDMTPDAHPVIGPAGPDGLFLAVGFCGAGFKKGPAVGQCLAELVLDQRSSTVDLSPFRLSRFTDGGWQAPWSDTEYRLSADFGHGL